MAIWKGKLSIQDRRQSPDQLVHVLPGYLLKGGAGKKRIVLSFQTKTAKQYENSDLAARESYFPSALDSKRASKVDMVRPCWLSVIVVMPSGIAIALHTARHAQLKENAAACRPLLNEPRIHAPLED